MCLESIGVRGSSYLNMAAHPDGSNRAFFSTQDGKIWLASIPTPGSGDTLEFHDEDDSSPFLDLTGRVVELMGLAFHAEFAANGRFFVSYTCDTAASPACSGSSAAATRTDSSSSPSSQYQLIVAEFSVANKSKATRAAASEVRRLFTLGVPYTSSSSDQQQHGGQILFRRPSDGYLYLMTGHGGDHFDNDTASFLGKIIRFNIDSTINGQTGGTSASSRHSNNRSAGTSTTPMEEPEIFAVGLSNPRGCSFDSDRPSYLFCANVDDQQQYDSVYLIGGPFVNAASLVVGYGAHPVSSAGSPPSPSIVGGLVYRGSADPSLKGRYLYMYGVSAWAAVEVPASSGRYVSTQIPDIRCSPAVPCIGVGVDGRRVVSFGEDNNNDAFLLATGAIYRVVAPGLCHHAAAPHRWSSGLPWLLSFGGSAVVFAFYQIYMRMFSGGQAAAGNGCITCFFDSIVCSCCNTVTSIINGAPPAAGVAGQALQLGV
ncbi:hypothetical protein BS78_08G105500 [Paspalum vaginatum]|nr:hypothetical protein BS78_08G105500 [Paspalum vaginatum]KAJ1265848.1 hypothetical protein BS78_08G105500 [Paspalum vaginatum]